jgi:phenylacetate-CoA ligase
MNKGGVSSYIRDDVETLARVHISKLQLERLQAGVRRVSATVPFYRDRLNQAGVSAEHIHAIEDLARLPFTTKSDLRDNYPFGLLAVPMQDVVRIHASSGTTGKPTVVAYTRHDIELWSDLIARCYAAAGVTCHDVVHNAYGYGLFTGGLGFHYGAERLGAAVIPVSGGNTKRQLMIMRDFGSTVLCCTPSYSLLLAEVIAQEEIDVASLSLKVGIFGAEPWSEPMRMEIESRLSITALNIYGLSEVIGPGVSCECVHKQGMHIFEDHFIPEIIDPSTGDPLPDGEMGELVLTCVTKEALPLLRYRTRDRTRLIREKCPCGRTSVRMDRIIGRTDDMIIVRGVNVFPSQIEAVLLTVGKTAPHYQIVVDRQGQMDELDVLVEMGAEMLSDRERLVQIERRLSFEVQSSLGITCNVKLVEPGQVARSEGKAVRVIDKRVSGAERTTP